MKITSTFMAALEEILDEIIRKIYVANQLDVHGTNLVVLDTIDTKARTVNYYILRWSGRDYGQISFDELGIEE